MCVCADCAAAEREALPLCNSEFKAQQPPEYRDLRSVLFTELVRFGSRRHALRVCSSRFALEEFELLKSKKERDEWISRKASEHRDMLEHSALCKAWLKHMQTYSHSTGEIGWRSEAQKLIDGYWPERSAFLDHKLVRRPEKLTDHAWNAMKSQLVNVLSQHKKSRLAREKQKVLTARYLDFKQQYKRAQEGSDCRNPIPAMGDFLTSPAIAKAIWETATDEPLTDDGIRKHISDHLPAFADYWRLEQTQELVQLMRASGFASAAESDLHLAATVFKFVVSIIHALTGEAINGCGHRTRTMLVSLN
ncbi:hypothetical protein GYMLUDRAFT_247356 [Collybiopsis luxurians FD-317 M1]|uniref:Uncharacterized protein n=1 Tax=Collybiopsis luxurians FD-317 M1 TaxID=944289 RepID=A0A0D0B1S9_9AGAR|nr:hypothetical protein GYMLUDRAFT_247356 [Collybiopsis luxurians FD-317 M1]